MNLIEVKSPDEGSLKPKHFNNFPSINTSILDYIGFQFHPPIYIYIYIYMYIYIYIYIYKRNI